MSDRTLECGCVPGKVLCTEAARLWAQVRAFAPFFDRSNEKKYQEAYKKYDRHVSEAV